MKYYRLSRGLNKNQLVPVHQNPFEQLGKDINPQEDWYTSLYNYDDTHFEEWQRTKSFKGMSGVTTNTIFFDFDRKDNLEEARQDALSLMASLKAYNIEESDIQICFTGFKGFSIRIKTVQEFTPTELANLTSNLAKNLSTYDPVVYDSQRIVRLMGTKHPKSGLYKIPLTLEELEHLSITEIKLRAADAKEAMERVQHFTWDTINLPKTIYEMSKRYEPPTKPRLLATGGIEDLNFKDRPRWMSNCKFSLQEGFFEDGQRHSALLILASTYRRQGIHFDMVYRMLKGVAEKQASVQGTTRFDDEESYRIAEQVFDEGWKGGTFSCKTDPFLRSVCERLGDKSCNATKGVDGSVVTMVDLKEGFKDYVNNIDKNTIPIGLPSLDKKVFISTGANVGVIGAAGAGKSAWALNVLNSTSKAGVKSVFASLDMHKNRMFEKIMYKISGLSRDELYAMFRENKEQPLIEKLSQEFGNVSFYKKSSPTVQDIKNYVLECQEQSGDKVKLVMLDYFERITSDHNEDTAASKKISGELQDLVDDLDVALVTLVQPNKFSLTGGPDTPIYNYTSIKGSSFLYQSFRIIMSLWRPFYNPTDFKDDKYLQMAVLKNDLGELSEFVFGWEGKRGDIYEIDDYDLDHFKQLMDRKTQQLADKRSGW